MKIIIILTLMISLLAVDGASSDYDFKKYHFYTYSDNINWSYCMFQFDRIPHKYWEGIRRINIQDDLMLHYDGFYYYGSEVMVIDDKDCPMDVIIHELAHHCQYKEKNTLYQMINHKGSFKFYYDKIWGEI